MATPTAIDVRARAKAEKAIAKYGRTLILRQPVRVEPTTGSTAGSVSSSPLSTESLGMNATATAGATEITLKKFGAFDPVPTGLLVAGDVLTIGSVDYTVTGGPYAVVAGVIGPVDITPALAAEATAGTGVTVTFSGTDHAIKGVCSTVDRRLIDGASVRSGDWQILVSPKALDDAGITVKVEDDLFLGDSTATARLAEVTMLSAISSGEQDAALWLFAREVPR